jgi:hypothetical protein
MTRTKRNRRKNKRKPPSEVASDIKMYYPIYSGWSQDTVPLFKHSSEALCWQLSRFLKDSICHCWTSDHYPKWLHHICGVLFDSRLADAAEAEIVGYKVKLKSSIEKHFFGTVDFFQYTGARASSVVLKCDDELFSSCRRLFKSHPDYQSSSTSIRDWSGWNYLQRNSVILELL